MPCIAGLYDPSIGLLINVGIFADGKLPDPNKPLSNVTLYTALVDTGASCTCVSKKVINERSLVAHSKITMVSASGNVDANAFMFYVAIPILLPGTTVSPAGAITAQIHTFSVPVQGMELINPPARCDILLGMDILSKCSFKMDFDRHYSLCW